MVWISAARCTGKIYNEASIPQAGWPPRGHRPGLQCPVRPPFQSNPGYRLLRPGPGTEGSGLSRAQVTWYAGHVVCRLTGRGSRGGRSFRPATFLCLAKPELASVPGSSPRCLTWKERDSWLLASRQPRGQVPVGTVRPAGGVLCHPGHNGSSPACLFIQDLRPDFCLLGVP